MKVLLPIDGSDCSYDTLKWVTETFDKATTDYFLISITPIVMDFPMTEEVMSATTELLKITKKNLEAQGCRVLAAEQLVGFPNSQICQYADEGDFDLVIVGSHGHSGFTRIVLGSVSEGVLEHCGKPVIVYRKAKKLKGQTC